MKAICVSAISSNEGKTLLTTALLDYFKDSVRPFKIGPDYIDPLFHKAICKTSSINLDLFMLKKKQVKWLFSNYSNKRISILEGVMGFYDGMDKGSSAYDVTKLLNIPTILLLNGSGSYITISAVLKGLLTYKEDNTIKAVVLNKISSQGHFELIKNQINKDFPNIIVLGWIKNNLKTLEDTHLGLDLKNAKRKELKNLSLEVLKNIDLEKLEKVAKTKKIKTKYYPFPKIEKINKKISIVNDKNFCFLYKDNLEFLKELFDEVEIINACKNQKISKDSSLVYIPGGYVETKKAFSRIKNANKFKKSLVKHSKNKHIFAECAGLLYLGKSVDDKKMSGILDVQFELTNNIVRLGYYSNEQGLKGHAFHYTNAKSSENASEKLIKNSIAKFGVWKRNKTYGTYLHTTFRNNINNLKEHFGIK